MEFTIKEGTIEEAVEMCSLLPEFEKPYGKEEFEERLKGKKHLILICYYYGMPIGFKLGYDRYDDGSFYSWLGGVLPGFRRNGVAGRLQERQEIWVREHGYQRILIKTRNKFQNMLRFSIAHGYQIIGFKEKGMIKDYRVVLQKELMG